MELCIKDWLRGTREWKFFLLLPENFGSEIMAMRKSVLDGLTEREGGGWLAGELPGNAGEDESLNQDLHGSSLRVQEPGARLCPCPIKYILKNYSLCSVVAPEPML
jgi:hypothetical protein